MWSDASGLKVSIAIVCCLLHASTAFGQATPAAGAAASELSGALEAIARRVTPAVVEIFTTSYTAASGRVGRSADLVATERSSGSGVIVDASGFIITNAHVVRGARRIHIELPAPGDGHSILATNSRLVPGRIVGIDIETDLAVVKVDEANLTTVGFGDSDTLKAGQLVLALGSPLGLRHSVALGVVSAVARQLEPESPMIYLQTDASINPGSSGGPLIDVRGQLVGINTLIASRGGGHEGVGFAAPSNIVRTVYEQIKVHGHVRRGDIGVRAQTLTPVLASGLGLPSRRGAVLADVLPGSPAAAAGLRQGDVVLTLDGKPIENARQLQVNLYRRFVGDTVAVDVWRDGAIVKTHAAVVERHHPVAGSSALDARENRVLRLGILGVTLDRRLALILPALRVTAGVVVVSTVADAIDARDGGLAPGDVIYAINRTAVQDLAQLRTELDRLKTGDPVVIAVERRGELLYVAFTVE
jgi:serine protease Do